MSNVNWFRSVPKVQIEEVDPPNKNKILSTITSKQDILQPSHQVYIERKPLVSHFLITQLLSYD